MLAVHHHLNSTKERRNANFTMGLEKSHLIVHASLVLKKGRGRKRKDGRTKGRCRGVSEYNSLFALNHLCLDLLFLFMTPISAELSRQPMTDEAKWGEKHLAQSPY